VDASKSFRVAQILGYDYAEFKKKVIGELKDLTLSQGMRAGDGVMFAYYYHLIFF
jgi:hypothetical protein